MEKRNLPEASIFKITGNTLYKYVYKGLVMHSVKQRKNGFGFEDIFIRIYLSCFKGANGGGGDI